MRNQHFNRVAQNLGAEAFALFEALHKVGLPLPGGVELRGNGTGYFNPVVTAFKDVPRNGQKFYSTVDPATNRRLIIAPIKNFSGLEQYGDEDQSLVFFERYTPNTDSPMVIIEQLSHTNSTPNKVYELMGLLSVVADWNL